MGYLRQMVKSYLNNIGKIRKMLIDNPFGHDGGSF